MTKSGKGFGALLAAAFGILQLLSMPAAAAQQETMLMFGTHTTSAISVRCETYIDKTFGRGPGAEHHRSAGFAACIERGGD